MKTIKIIALVFVLALSVTNCAKSKAKPRCSHEKEQQTQNNTTSTPTGRISSSSMEENQVDLGQDDPKFIVGSGDDDRDGGDKKPKAR
jgi:hypothetical protein